MIKDKYKGQTIHLKGNKIVLDDITTKDIPMLKKHNLEYVLKPKKKEFKGIKEDGFKED